MNVGGVEARPFGGIIIYNLLHAIRPSTSRLLLPHRLITRGFRLASLQPEAVNLETAFMRLTKGLVA
jgi:hypothetical protein